MDILYVINLAGVECNEQDNGELCKEVRGGATAAVTTAASSTSVVTLSASCNGNILVQHNLLSLTPLIKEEK